MREKLIELLYKAENQADKRCDGAENCDKCPGNNQDIDCLDWLKGDCLLSLGVTIQKWIPVTERLPDQYHKVLMAGRNGGVFIGERTSGTTAVSDGHCRGFTHWMELPEAPED